MQSFSIKNIILLILITYTSHCFSNQSTIQPIVGSWKLISVTRTQAGREVNDYGPHPKGYLTYTPDGHVMVIMVQDHRIKPKERMISPDEAQQLLTTMTSYAGTYQVIDDKIIHHIDLSWNENWSGTQQVRYYQLKGNRLILTMAPFVDQKYGEIIVRIIWEKLPALMLYKS